MEVGVLWGQWKAVCSAPHVGPWSIPGLGHERCSEITSAGCVLTSDFSFWAKVIKTGRIMSSSHRYLGRGWVNSDFFLYGAQAKTTDIWGWQGGSGLVPSNISTEGNILFT